MGLGTVLAATILLPLVGAIAVAIIPARHATWARPAALGLSGTVLALTMWLWTAFDRTGDGMQFELVRPWVPGLGTSFHIGVDGLSLPLICLTALLTVLAIVASGSITEFRREYFTLMLMLEAGLIGVFAALDLIVFFVFWEVVLIPMFFLIQIWGGPRRQYAAVKFFVYTLAGSLAMLGGMIALFLYTGTSTFDMHELALLADGLDVRTQTALFLAFAFALAIKVPIVPFHTWLPDAHVEAPTAVSVLLAGVLLKMGSYGFIRFGPQLLPEGFRALAPAIALLAAISIVYGAAVALMQTDLKKIVAFSSISHMGYVMLGIATATSAGLMGASVQMVSHGLLSGMAFLLVGAFYERAHTREIDAFGGTAKVAPILSGALVFAAFGSLGLPGMSGFIGEFLVVLGSFRAYTSYSVLAATTVVLTAGYLLWMLKRVVFGPLNAERADMGDMTPTEAIAIMPLCIATVLVGVFPQTLVGVMSSTVEGVARLLGG